MHDEGHIVRKILPRHMVSLEQLENAVQFLKYYGYLLQPEFGGNMPDYVFANAVRWFQKMSNVTVDGVVGPETLEAMLAPRCGNSDQMVFSPIRWKKNQLNLFVEGYVPILAPVVQDALIDEACASWAKFADVTFRRVASKSGADVYVQSVPLDGPGQVLAQAQLPPGDDQPLFLQMDSRESAWVKALEGQRGEILYRNVFCHELGHNLGLGHSASNGARNVPVTPPLMAPYYNVSVNHPLPDDDVSRIISLYGPATAPPTPVPPTPVPPIPPVPTPTPVPPGGKTMTKEQLKTWLVNIAKLVATVAPWMIGPLSWVKSHLLTLSGFLETLAGNDFLLDLILMLVNRGQLKLPMTVEHVEQLKTDVEALTAK